MPRHRSIDNPNPTRVMSRNGPTRSPRHLVNRWAIPIAAWLLSTAVIWTTAQWAGVDFWNPASRQRWDSQWYLSIAQGPYESFRCIDRYPTFPDVWCGNTAWFPGYPVAIRLVAAFGIPLNTAAIVVTSACLLGSFALLWRLLDARLTWASALAMALASVFSGVIYFHVDFPTSMCLLGLLILTWGVRNESWVVAGVGAFVALSTHLVGAIGLAALALSVTFGWRRYAWPGRLWRVGSAVTLGALAYPWTMLLIHAGTGSWTIYWEHQREAYGNAELHNPIEEIQRFWDTPFGALYPPDPNSTWLVTHSLAAHQSQLLINLALAALIATTFIWRLTHHDLSAWEVLAALVALGAVAVPLLSGAWSAWYRHNAMMLVALPVLRLPRYAWLAAVAIFAAQAVLLGGMWFGGALV